MILNASLYGKKERPPIIHINCKSGSINLGVAVIEALKLKPLDKIAFRKLDGIWYMYKCKKGFTIYSRCNKSRNMGVSNKVACSHLSNDLLDGIERGHLSVNLVPLVKSWVSYYELKKVSQ